MFTDMEKVTQFTQRQEKSDFSIRTKQSYGIMQFPQVIIYKVERKKILTMPSYNTVTKLFLGEGSSKLSSQEKRIFLQQRKHLKAVAREPKKGH